MSDDTTHNLGKVKGADGAAGKDGAQGPKGDKGDTGATGAPGRDGKDGRDGSDGYGTQGPKGDKGETGAQGPKGDTGAPGKDGVTTIVKLEFNNKEELVATYSDGTEQNFGRIANRNVNAKRTQLTAEEQARCTNAALGWGLPLLALIPIGLLANAGLPAPAIAPELQRQIAEADAQFRRQFGMSAGQLLGGLAALVYGISAAAHLATVCTPGNGSSR
ncbi:collagen-like protein [Corynebacterium aquatimens]|uniref:collagen-like protein n=1 Tax=Corynebacterium aquatimens TaxID=1190508 RepID=UPI0025417515|nr:collagen-like protein [Corynebacterium aquatimens]QYH19263.1 collagen-like protein [Corynebacterium aquatimens]